MEPGDVVVLADGRGALVTARVEAEPGPLAALLEVAIAPAAAESDVDYLAHGARSPRTRAAATKFLPNLLPNSARIRTYLTGR